MAKAAQKVAAAMAVAMAFLGASRTAAAVEGEDVAIVVRVRNYAGISSESLARAQEEATRIYAAAGVRTVWLADNARSEFDRAPHLTVLLLSREMADRKIVDESIADQVLGQAARAATRAYLFSNRIAQVAVRYRIDPDRLLGKVIAHELGHLVLPERSHSTSGIMRVDLDLQHRVQRFTQDQASLMRTTLVADGRVGQ